MYKRIAHTANRTHRRNNKSQRLKKKTQTPCCCCCCCRRCCCCRIFFFQFMDLWTKTNKFSFVPNTVTLRRFNQRTHTYIYIYLYNRCCCCCRFFFTGRCLTHSTPVYFKYEFNPYHCILSSGPLRWTVVCCRCVNRYKFRLWIAFYFECYSFYSSFTIVIRVNIYFTINRSTNFTILQFWQRNTTIQRVNLICYNCLIFWQENAKNPLICWLKTWLSRFVCK